MKNGTTTVKIATAKKQRQLLEIFCKKSVLRNFIKFTAKHTRKMPTNVGILRDS